MKVEDIPELRRAPAGEYAAIAKSQVQAARDAVYLRHGGGGFTRAAGMIGCSIRDVSNG